MSIIPKSARLVAALASALALTAACSSNGAESHSPTKLDPGQVQIKGEGVTRNPYGGAALALGEPRDGGELKLGMITPADTLDPITPLSTGAVSAAVGIYDTLMKVQPDGTVVPNLATGMESEDDQHWTLTLPGGVTFTDGTPYDADAVIAHIKRYTSPAATARDAGTAKQITATRKVDATTVEMDIARPNVDFPLLFVGSLGMVPSPAAVAKDPKGFGLHPVGAGPFKVESFKPGGDLVLVRNPGYHGQRPHLDKLTMVTAPDSQARLSALKAGDLDLASTTDASDFARAESAGLTVLQQPLYTYYYLTLNLSKPPFDDAGIRKALIQAIDTETISKAVFGGLANPMKGWFVPNHPEYTEVDYPSFDPDAAKKAVDAYSASHGPVTFELQTTPSPENDRATAIIQQMLEDVGIHVRIATYDQPTSILNVAQGKYAAVYRFIGFTLGAVNDMNTRFRTGSPGTITHAGNPQLDALLDQMARTPVADRHDLFVKAQNLLADWMPSVPLVQQSGAWIVGDRVGGFPGTQGEQTADMVRIADLWAAN